MRARNAPEAKASAGESGSAGCRHGRCGSAARRGNRRSDRRSRRVRARESLAELGYSGAGLPAVLGGDGGPLVTPADLAVYERRLAQAPGPLAEVIRLLALGWPRGVAAVVDALGRPAVDTLLESGCVAEHGGELHPRVRIVPHGDLWLAADRRHEAGTAPDPLQVTGINPPANLLAALTVRRPIRRALDVGTGNGVQALLAARHSEHVVATDVNPRALSFAAFNAALNGSTASSSATAACSTRSRASFSISSSATRRTSSHQSMNSSSATAARHLAPCAPSWCAAYPRCSPRAASRRCWRVGRCVTRRGHRFRAAGWAPTVAPGCCTCAAKIRCCMPGSGIEPLRRCRRRRRVRGRHGPVGAVSRRAPHRPDRVRRGATATACRRVAR